MIQVEGIDHVALTVRDVEASVAWYRDVLGLGRMHEAAWGSHPAVVGTGGTSVALFQERPASSSSGGRTLGFRHLAFRVDAGNFSSARSSLESAGVRYEFADHGISQSIYFEDPDGNEIELTTYQVQRLQS
jgi:catechol 2,3-dioxygenase-like lactoylglutathione lyase family enzyme